MQHADKGPGRLQQDTDETDLSSLVFVDAPRSGCHIEKRDGLLREGQHEIERFGPGRHQTECPPTSHVEPRTQRRAHREAAAVGDAAGPTQPATGAVPRGPEERADLVSGGQETG